VVEDSNFQFVPQLPKIPRSHARRRIRRISGDKVKANRNDSLGEESQGAGRVGSGLIGVARLLSARFGDY
jgi:hypothetical protein